MAALARYNPYLSTYNRKTSNLGSRECGSLLHTLTSRGGVLIYCTGLSLNAVWSGVILFESVKPCVEVCKSAKKKYLFI